MKLKDYIQNTRGAGAEIAKIFGVSRAYVSQITTGKRPVPMRYCPRLEMITSGLVTCEELRPDVDWALFRKLDVQKQESIIGG